MRFGMNINGQSTGDSGYLFDVMGKMQPEWVLVVNDPDAKISNGILSATSESTKVILRKYSDLNGTQWLRMTPETYAAELMALGNKHLWKYILNEPHAGGVQDVLRMSKWITRVVEIMTDAGHKVVAANYPVGSWHTWVIDAGAYDPLLRILSERRDVAKLGTHEYTGIFLGLGVGKMSRWDLLERDKVQPEMWPSLDTVINDDGQKLGDYMTERVPTTYHLLRSHWFQQRAKQKGFGPIEIVINEFGWDRNSDLAEGQNHIFAALEKRYGVANGHNQLHGAYTLENVWKYYWPNWSVSEAIFNQFKWADSIYNQDEYTGILPFMWSFDHWGKAGFNFGADKALMDMMIGWAEEQRGDTPDSPIEPEPTPPIEPEPTPPIEPEPTPPVRKRKQRIGFNIQNGAVPDIDHFIEVQKRIQPTATTVINGYGLASRLADELPNTIVIHRDYDIGNDQDMWKSIKPKELVSRYRKRHQDKRVWVYLLNEPMVGTDAKDIKKFVSWLVETTELLVAKGYKVVSGNLATGAHRWEDIDAGLYDDWIKMLARHPENVLAGYHEYTANLIQFGTGVWETWDMLDEDRVQFANWQKRRDLPISKIKGSKAGDYPEYWHVLRGQWFNVRAQEIGVPIHKSVITECFWDRMGDISRLERNFEHNGKTQNIYDHLEDIYGVADGWYFLKGHETYKKVWAGYYPNLTFDQATFEQLKWANEECYPDSVVGFTMFAWTWKDDWHVKYGHNFGEQEELFNLLETYAQEIAEAPEVPDESDIPDDEEPDMPTEIDMLEYMRGDGRIYDVHYNFPGYAQGTERMQTQKDGRRFYHVKGSPGTQQYNWEELWYDDIFINRGTDVSPNELQYYQTSTNGRYGQRWIPRKVKVGTLNYSAPEVVFRDKANSQISRDVNPNPYVFPHWIECKKIYSSYTFESGIRLNDVVELWGYLDDNGEPGLNFERYFYAKGYGLVGWQDPTKNWRSYIERDVQASGKLPMLQVNGLILPPLPPEDGNEPPIDNVTIPNSDPRWQKAWLSSVGAGGTNVRQRPTTRSEIVGRIMIDVPGLILVEEQSSQADGLWIPVRINITPDKTHENGDFSNFGWIRSDVFEYTKYEADNGETTNSVEIYIEYSSSDKVRTKLISAMRNIAYAMKDDGVTVIVETKQIE